jgi:hypothetical protein
MAVYRDIITQQSYESGYYISGTFDSGATVLWGNRAVQLTGGPVDPRILSCGSIDFGLSETWGADLSIPSLSLEIDNADASLAPYVLGTPVAAAASTEYGGDSFLNFSCVLWHWVKDGATIYTQQISPTLVCNRSPSIKDTTISLDMQMVGSAQIDRNKYGTISVRQLLDSAAGSGAANGVGGVQTYRVIDAHRKGGPYDPGGTAAADFEAFAVTQADFADALAAGALVEDGDGSTEDAIPFLLGRTYFKPMGYAVPLPIDVAIGRGDTTPFRILGACVRKPDGIPTCYEWTTWAGGRPDIRSAVAGEQWIPGGVFTIQRLITCYDGIDRDVWFVLVWGDSLYLPPASAHVGVINGRGSSPAALMHAIIEDLGPGTSFVVGATFVRAELATAHLAGCFGGALVSDAPLVGALASLAASGSIAVWVNYLGQMECFAYPGWGIEEVALAAASLPVIYDADILAWDTESVPTIDDERGGGATRCRIEWTDEQRAGMPAVGRIDRAYGRATDPSEVTRETLLPGDWICPARAGKVLAHTVKHRNRTIRRIHLTTRLWVGTTYHVGQLFRLVSSRGRGGAGYSNRLVRFEWGSLDLDQDATTVRLEDLGPLEALRPVTLDDELDWVRFDPSDSAPADNIKINSGTATIDATNWSPSGVGVAAGDSLWSFGAATASHRRSLKILTVGAASFTVEANGNATETLTCSAAGTDILDRAWIIMKSQSTYGPTNTEKLTVCDEGARVFRDGLTAGFNVSG